MVLDAVVIILREVLEAALLLSLLLAIGKLSGIRAFWFAVGIPLGIIGAYLYANQMESVSALFDYTGQELINGIIQIGIYLAVLAVIGLLAWSGNKATLSPLSVVMGVTVALAITREGSEIILYLQTYSFDQHKLARALTGGLVGACIGASIGVIVYFALVLGDKRRALAVSEWVLVFVAAGILGQIVPLFEQIDLIPSATPVWDSSGLVSETSVLGQLLYAVAGYEATPSIWQLSVYLLGLALFAPIYLLRQRG